jgi:hypothetical protein
MQIRLVRSILPATDGPTKVTAICWSPNSFRLAVATHDRVITLFDENGEQKRDRFSTKPADAARKDYVITGLAWSPDSTKLAVAQSDNIVFVYKVRAERRSGGGLALAEGEWMNGQSQRDCSERAAHACRVAPRVCATRLLAFPM